MNHATATLRALDREAHYRQLSVQTPDGLRINAQDWAQPTSGRDVLLLHGYSQSHLSWLKQVSGPLARKFRLVSYDNRGHGGSDKPLEPHFYREAERWAGEVAAVIRTAGLHRPVLVAWSYAGRIVLDYLTCHGDAQISGVVFVGASSKSDASVLGPAAPLLRQMTENNVARNIEATTSLLRACTAQPLPEEELRYLLAFNMLVPPIVRANLSGRAADYEATLRGLSVPVLAIHGAHDPINLPTMAEYTVSHVRQGRLLLYPGVAHMPFWEDADAFERDLASFLREIG